MPNFVAIGQTTAEISRFWQPPSWIFKILTIRTVKKNKLHHCAKFSQNRSNHGGDMSVFDFQDGGHRHLEFSNFQIFNGRNSQES